MRWLLLKDLQILKRSPLLVGVLIAYSVVVSLVAGLALSSGPGKPRVAFANLVPEDKSEVALGGRTVDATQYADKLFAKVEPIRVKTREQAIAKVKSGEALGALVVPADVTERLQGTLGLGGGGRPTVEVYYSAENPLKTQFVKDTIDATLAEANAAISAEVLKESAKYLNVIVAGGKVALPLVGSVDILGLRNARKIIDSALAGLPEDAPERVALEQVSRFAGLAADNLDLSKPILASISKPVQVKRIVVAGSDSSLSAFAAEVAVVASMMFVALLLAAGMLALEREENAFGRLVRGLISRTGLVTEKVGLAALAAFVITTVMLGILGRADRLRLHPRAAVARRARARRGGVRGDGGRDRRGHARGPLGVAGRVRGLAAGRGARADPERRGRRDALRRHPRGLGRVPVPPRPAGARRRHQRRHAAHAAAPPRRADAGVRRDRSRLAASLRVSPSTIARMAFPATRLRRLRATTGIRDLVRETELAARHLVYPMFVVHGSDSRTPIPTMPGIDHLSIRHAVQEAGEAAALGIPAVLLFGLPASKDEEGSGAWDDEGVIQLATRAIKAEHPDLLVITDLCLCEYTSHGHCGVLRADGVVDNDATLELLARTAVSQAAAGADAVAPSDMMDGRVGALRTALDEHDLAETPIIAYSAKFASAFYGPFREAADSAPQQGDRRGYQMDPANALEAEREAELDAAEGADVVMVKPALPYLDVIRRVKERTRLPVAAYNVSGEYAMIKAAAAAGLLDERAAVLEAMTGIRRAGADIVITYHAKDVARWLQ